MKTDPPREWVTAAILTEKAAFLEVAQANVGLLIDTFPSLRGEDANRAVMLGMLRAGFEIARQIDLNESDVIQIVKIDFKNP